MPLKDVAYTSPSEAKHGEVGRVLSKVGRHPYGPRVVQSGLGLIADYPWSAPYEELKLKDNK